MHRTLAKWSRWLHIYLSMLSLGAILFFSLTGFTLNHPDWFFRESTSRYSGNLDKSWLHLNMPAPRDSDPSDFGHQIDKLSVVEYLRAEHRLSGRLGEFIVFEDECEVNFQGPGYAATARVKREDGSYEVDVTTNDLVSVMNDFHKGRHTGPFWSLVIDISAIVSAIVAFSGFVLIFYLKLNRPLRIWIAVGGSLLVVIMIIRSF
ncbi:MAG: PepSY-associated TM helix domain-containing protein [Pirellula sp.]